ncbi:kinase-like protein [Westerdykella ornata]|uniref:EKC/KEOPS complex subunit BUD32 n=1 Tax=Westerdykella ornata TaxID=318751 RepID=A0A6A6JWM3_WESOR|nr:kinase-like protein [Westerdykella ornata]KAF2281011.1 kinase-like protein [Westerdykella ornata]
MSDEVQYPTGFGLADIVSWGIIGMVCLHKSSQTVVKSPHDEKNNDFITTEKKIYERVEHSGGHPGLLRYYGPYDEFCIRLEYAPHGQLHSFLLKNASMSTSQRLRWIVQITEALSFVHRVGVVHGDLTCSNVLLDADMNAKLADFSGSSLDGSPLLVVVTPSHAYPGEKNSTKAHLFALGSLIYQIMTGFAPYNDLSEEETESKYLKGEFPATKSLGEVGNIISKCWRCDYNTADVVARDLRVMDFQTT